MAYASPDYSSLNSPPVCTHVFITQVGLSETPLPRDLWSVLLLLQLPKSCQIQI
jgi:hypothetical protein